MRDNNSEKQIVMTEQELDTFVSEKIVEALNVFSQKLVNELDALYQIIEDCYKDATFCREILIRDPNLEKIYNDICKRNEDIQM